MSADFDVARISLDFTLLVAGDHVAGDYPATREAAVEARAIFEGVRARPYLERLDAAMVASARRRAGSPAAERRPPLDRGVQPWQWRMASSVLPQRTMVSSWPEPGHDDTIVRAPD